MGDKMDMALDDIIKTTKGSGSRGRGGRSGGASGRSRGSGARGGRGSGGRGSGGGNRSMSNGAGRSGMSAGRWSHDMYQGGSGGSRMAAQSTGPVKLNISNLDYGVTDSDIRELFQEFGNMRTAAVHYDRSGCSLGSAQVLFDHRMEAVKAMQQYNGVHLDGRPMKIFLEGDGGMRGGRMGGGGGGGGGHMVKRLQGSRPEPLIPRRGAGGRGGSGGGRGAGGRGGRGGKGGEKAKPKTAEELDAELDNYLCEAKKTKE